MTVYMLTRIMHFRNGETITRIAPELGYWTEQDQAEAACAKQDRHLMTQYGHALRKQQEDYEAQVTEAEERRVQRIVCQKAQVVPPPVLRAPEAPARPTFGQWAQEHAKKVYSTTIHEVTPIDRGATIETKEDVMC